MLSNLYFIPPLSYLREVLEEFRPQAASQQFLVEKLEFKGLIFIFLCPNWVLEINLFDEFSQKIAVKVFSELIRQLWIIRYSPKHKWRLTLSSSLEAVVIIFLLLI